jgi:hypothetical protein
VKPLTIKSLSSPDVSIDSWQPESTAVCFLLELEIAEEGDERADLFQVVVATPEGLRRLPADANAVLSDRGALILAEFSWPRLHATLHRILRECGAEDWSAAVLRLQRYFLWEYEDYIEGPEN